MTPRVGEATANICTNQGLLALRAAIYMSLMGKHGLPQVARLCYYKAQYAAGIINNLPNYSLKYGRMFLKEFTIETEHDVDGVIKYCAENGFLIQKIYNGSENNLFQIAITEQRSKEEIDRFVSCLRNYN